MRKLLSLMILALLPQLANAEGDPNQTQNEATDTIRGFEVCEYFNCDMFVDHMAFNIVSDDEHTVEVTNLWPAEMYADRWIYKADTLTIPETVVWHDVTYSVKAIGPWTFTFSDVENLVIPPSVSVIKTKAFYFAGSETKKVVIPSTVTEIEDYAFGFDEGRFLEYQLSLGTECHIDTLQFLSETPCINQTIPVKSVLIVPKGTIESYRNALAPMGDKYTIIEDDKTTAIQGVQTSNQEESYYSLDGRRLNSPKKGLNIIRMSDGTTKKVLVK